MTRDHPIIRAGAGKLHYDETQPVVGGRLALFEADDPARHLQVQPASTAPTPTPSAKPVSTPSASPHAAPQPSQSTASAPAPSYFRPTSQAQADDEEGRYYSQDVFNDEMYALLDPSSGRAAAEPFFVLMSTPAVHPPLDSRHRHRVHTFASRRAQLSAEAHCPWHDQWANTANPTQCSATARHLRFEREAMAVGVDEGIGGAAARLKSSGAYNRCVRAPLCFSPTCLGGAPLH